MFIGGPSIPPDDDAERALMGDSMDRDLMQRSQESSFGSYSQRLANNSKLGINSNIYSLYQNNHNKPMRTTGPDVTISQVPSSGYEPGRSEMTLSKVPGSDYTRHSSLSPGGHQAMPSDLINNKTRPSEHHSYPEATQRQSFDGKEQVSEIRESVDSNGSESLFSACMQEKGDVQRKSVADSSTRDEDNPTNMEPDSSTDDQESRISQKESQSNFSDMTVDAHKDQGSSNKNRYTSRDANESDYEGDEYERIRMQQYHKDQAKMCNIKPEPEGQPDAKRQKTFKTPQEELAELMKLTNEKLFRNSNRMGANHLPLSVEIEELDSSSDSVSPPRNMSNPFMPNSLITNSLSPRKRGRKPKHYSEILFELGQRGISITKTHKPTSHSQTEMVVSESGAVSHKTSGQQLKCPHCNKILTTSVGLMYHIRLHTGKEIIYSIIIK